MVCYVHDLSFRCKISPLKNFPKEADRPLINHERLNSPWPTLKDWPVLDQPWNAHRALTNPVRLIGPWPTLTGWPALDQAWKTDQPLTNLDRLTGPWPTSAMRFLVALLVTWSVHGAGTSSTIGVWYGGLHGWATMNRSRFFRFSEILLGTKR